MDENFINKQRFVEKYRPTDLNIIRGNENIIKCLKSFDINDLPNMLFHGPPGTGKTTAIKALIHQKMSMFNVLELNASDDRGIDVVRNEIKHFAEASVEHRLVILDEVDFMSKDAQGALRRIMEDYYNCRFCLICNYARKIIEPIQSRCAKFRFKPIETKYMKRYICDIIRKEDMKVEDEDGINILLEGCEGDLRKLVNDLQGIKRSYEIISKRNVEEFLGKTGEEFLDEIWMILNDKAISYEEAYKKINRNEIECETLADEMFKRVLKEDSADKFDKIIELAKIEEAISLGCSEAIQLGALVGLFKR